MYVRLIDSDVTEFFLDLYPIECSYQGRANLQYERLKKLFRKKKLTSYERFAHNYYE